MDKVGLSGKYKAYPEYKDSGVEWLGLIPNHWMVTHLKRYSSVQGGYAFSSDSFVDSGKAVIRIGDIKQDGSVSLDSCKYINANDAEQYQQYAVVNGDLLMAMTGATIGKAGWFKGAETALLNQRVGTFKCSESYLNFRFFWYVLNSSGYQEYIKLTAFGGAQPNISDTGMVGYISAFPTNSEQQKIANFLDHETAKIDTLIEKQQQLIKLLKEKRQAVISHAVTKGLNPNAPMRDSGVEWLGEVPEDWTVTPLKYVCKLIDGDRSSTYPNDGDLVDKGIPFVSSKNIVNFKLTKKNLNYITIDKYKALGRGKLANGDLVITVRGTIGHVGIFDQEVIGCHTGFINAQMMIMRPNFGLTNYLQSISESSSWLGQLDIAAYGSTVRQLSNEILGNIIIAIPPVSEIHNFIESVNSEILKFEGLISKAELGIQLMQERRTALISAAVTGKIDVRDWVAPESSNNTIDSRLRGNDAELNAAVDLNKVADLSKEAGL